MTTNLARLFLAWAIAIAVPVQAMAAVSAGLCMAFGHHEPAGSEGHAHDGADADASGHAAQSHSDEGAAQQAGEGGKNSHCGPCAACCASASIAGPAGLSILSAPSAAEYHFAQLPPPGVRPHSFDRPPLAL